MIDRLATYLLCGVCNYCRITTTEAVFILNLEIIIIILIDCADNA